MQVITSIIKCGMKLRIHSQTSTMKWLATRSRNLFYLNKTLYNIGAWFTHKMHLKFPKFWHPYDFKHENDITSHSTHALHKENSVD